MLVIVTGCQCGSQDLVESEAQRASSLVLSTHLSYRHGEPDRYFEAFAEQLRCFHDERGLPRADLRAAREPQLVANAARGGSFAISASSLNAARSGDRGDSFSEVAMYSDATYPRRAFRRMVQTAVIDGRTKIVALGGVGSVCEAEINGIMPDVGPCRPASLRAGCLEECRGDPRHCRTHACLLCVQECIDEHLCTECGDRLSCCYGVGGGWLDEFLELTSDIDVVEQRATLESVHGHDCSFILDPPVEI